MRKFLTVAAVMLCMLVSVVGCRRKPTPEVMYAASSVIGIAAGKVANELKVDDGTRNALIEVLNLMVQVIPGVDQTFEDAWMPIAVAYIDGLVKEGKLTAAQAGLVKTAFALAVKGLDYMFIRWPDAKQYENLVIAAIDGFASGFLDEFRPANANVVDRVYRPYDRKAYEYLKGFVK